MSFPPSFARTFSSRERRLGTRQEKNSPYFCVFKYARAVKQKVWNEDENGERDWGETRDWRVRLARFARVRLLHYALPISLLILRKKTTVLQSALHLEPKVANTRLIPGDEYA